MSPYTNYSKSYRSRGSKTMYHSSSSSRPAKRGPRGQYIDPSRFVRVAKSAETREYTPQHQFSDFAVAPLLHANLSHKGYVDPTPIQDQAIPEALSGKDIIGIANTGTGKTAAFAIPLLNKLITNPEARALIVAPTRELAQQIEGECQSIASRSGLCGAVLIGGSPMGPQLRDLQRNPQIVIGTPGRIKDHLERGTLRLGQFNIVVLDEVDRMLDMGFINDVTHILNGLASVRQSFFFSATLNPKVRELISKFSRDPATITVKTGETADNVHQDVVRYSDKDDKMSKLHDLLVTSDMKVIVFDETKHSVDRLSKELVARGFKADSIHGGKTQGQRQRALERFKKNDIKILVATDVAARGIDVVDITHVVNYSQPQSYEDYVHRIGRAGRAGQIGYALTFVAR